MDRNYIIKITGTAPRRSLSARRAWIEIITQIKIATGCVVALRKESVDRNTIVLAVLLMYSWSLSARRAWIEIVWVLQS